MPATTTEDGRARLHAALVVALALGLRVAWVLSVPTKPVGDFAMYLESAEHVAVFGALDPEYVYMPGYILLLAAVKALGGGWLAAKLVGAVLGGLAAGAVFGIARRLAGPRAGLVAGLLCAVWPAGVAVASVTGTDMPAAALTAIAGWCLVRWGVGRPFVAAALFGAVMGLSAYVRAVSLPLTALAFFYFWWSGARWATTIRATALACVVATVVLSPWVVRNRLRYGETFATDSHGGLTALVGANPNSEGTYSRSLNRMFTEVTGYVLLAEPHRQADRASYEIAKDWTRFSPAYAVGLLVKKAERLLANERPLLYWPIYRAGVLRDPQAAFFARWRKELELIVDVFYALAIAAALVGFAVAAVRRRWVLFAFVPAQLALIAMYAIFFAEARYHLPVVLLLFPPAAVGWLWVGEGIARVVRERRVGVELRREAVAAALVCAVVLAGWPLLLRGGAALRHRHAWAVHVCRVAGQARFCKWRGDPGVRGVWNGVGLAADGERAVTSSVELPSGDYQLLATLVAVPAGSNEQGEVVVSAGGATARVPLADLVEATPIRIPVSHTGERLRLRLAATGKAASARVWLDDLRVVRAEPR